MSNEVDWDAAMNAVVEDMGKAALQFKGKRYAPKPKPAEKAPEAAPADESGGPTLSELESMISEG